MSRQEILDRIREKIKEEKKGQGKHSYIKILIKKNCNLNKNNSYSRIHSNPVDRNRFLSIQKTMSSIVLYPAFYEYKNCTIIRLKQFF